MSRAMPMQVAVIGGGSWGTTVAHLCAKNAPTTLWARRDDVAAEVRDHHRNSQYLEGFDLTPSLHATSSLEEAVGAGRRAGDGRAEPRHPGDGARSWRRSSGRGCRW